MIGRARSEPTWIFREIAHYLATGRGSPLDPVTEMRRSCSSRLDDHIAFRRERRRAHPRASTSAGSAPASAGRRVPARRCSARTADGQRRRRRYFDELAARGRWSNPGQRHARPPRHPTAQRCHPRHGIRAVGQGGPRRMTKKRVRLNGGNDIGRSVRRSLDEIFRKLEGSRRDDLRDGDRPRQAHAAPRR